MTYLTKYMELLDTVFLFLKKKPLSMCTSLICVTLETDTLQPSSTATTTARLLSSATPS